MSYNRCTLHWACDAIHPPHVRISGNICGRGGRGLIVTSGSSDAEYWLMLAIAPRAIIRDPEDKTPLLFPLPPQLKGVCVTLSH